VFGEAAQPGSDEQGADLVAVQPDGVGLIVQAGPADMDRRGMIEEILLHGIAVEAGDRAQPTSDRGVSWPSLLQCPGVGLDICTTRREQC
jgi:hypothetical protein